LCITTSAAALPGFAAVRAAHRPSDLTLLDRHGEAIHVQRIDAQARRGPWVTLAELSPALRQAIVLGEDRRFWAHGGVDWPALAAAAWANAWNQRTRGASTLTMQLAGLLDDALRRGSEGRSLGQKLGQIGAAQQLEARWSKAQILEAYLNLVPLRGETVGVAAASALIFGKHPSGLDATEAAVLAALVRAPNAAPAEVTRRACAVLAATQGAMQPAAPPGGCSSVEFSVAAALARKPGALDLDAPGNPPQLAPHFARQWLAAGGSARTTLDAGLQRQTLAALRQQIAELRGREVDDGAVVVIHNASGEVRAWVGSAGNTSAVDAVLARRQPGSTIKPFVYALAFERGLLAAESQLEDAPLQLASGSDSWLPRNFDHRWRGWVSAREALGASLNVPAVRVAAMLGPEALFENLERNGLRPRQSAGFHGHALALGSAEVTLLELTNAYRTLASAGHYRALAWPQVAGAKSAFAGQAAERRVYRPPVAASVGAILADNSARAASFGFDNPLVTRRWAAVKTGTSKDMRDNWCIGYTTEYTVGVWVGNASGAPMHGVSGVVGAAPVWRRIVDALPEPAGQTPQTPHATLQVARAKLPRASGEPWRITTPLDGSVLAFDPDIPARAQQLRLAGPRGSWTMNGQPLGSGRALDWPLVPGSHVLEVHDARRQLIDRVRFEVRPGVKPQRLRGNRAWPSRPRWQPQSRRKAQP
jgi:penicillin-binding protein 1C